MALNRSLRTLKCRKERGKEHNSSQFGHIILPYPLIRALQFVLVVVNDRGVFLEWVST
jgi:hypothetical protein